VRGVQAALYGMAMISLGFAARAFAHSTAAALLLQIVLLAYPAPLPQADQIQSDSLSSTIIVLFAAQVLRLAVRPSAKRMLSLAVLAAAGITLRPDNLALFPPIAALLMCQRSMAERLRGAAQIGVCLALAMAATPLAHRLRHDAPDSGQPLARGLIQKVLFLPPSPHQPGSACDAGFIDSASAGLVAYWRGAPPEYRDVLRLRISNLLRYNVIIPGLADRHAVTATVAVEPILACYTLARARAMPWSVSAGVIHEYRNLVLNYTSVDAAWRRGYFDYMQSHPAPLPVLRPIPPSDLALYRRAAAELGDAAAAAAAQEDSKTTSLSPPAAHSDLAIWGIKLIQAAGCATAWLFILAITVELFRKRRAGKALVAGAALALALQLHLAAVAALEIAQPRYTYPVWPLIVVVLFVGLQLLAAPLRGLATRFATRVE
jgi:hypothetical protein